MAKRKTDFDSNTALLDAPPVTSTRSAPAPPELVDIVDRVAGQFVSALAAAYASVERMHNQSRTDPSSQEALVFRSVGWDRLIHPGRAIWQRQLGLEKSRCELRDNLGSPEERQEEVGDLAAAQSKWDSESPELLAEIATLQAKVKTLRDSVDDAQGTVSHRESILQRAADPRHIPEHIAADFRQRRSVVKKNASEQSWWELQGAMSLLPLLDIDATSQNALLSIENALRSLCPEAIIDGGRQIFDHIRAASWLAEKRREFEFAKPRVEQGRRELAAELESIDQEEKSWFLRDHDRRLMEAK